MHTYMMQSDIDYIKVYILRRKKMVSNTFKLHSDNATTPVISHRFLLESNACSFELTPPNLSELPALDIGLV